MNINIPIDKEVLKVDDEYNGDLKLSFRVRDKYGVQTNHSITIPKAQRARLAEACIGTNLLLLNPTDNGLHS